MWGQGVRQWVGQAVVGLMQLRLWLDMPWRQAADDQVLVAVDMDLAWVTCFDMRLTDALHADDVWFQLQTEAAAQMHLSVDAVVLDFFATHESAVSQVLYRVFALPKDVLTRVQMALSGMDLRLLRLGVYDPQGLYGAELSAINFLPYRQMLLQQRKRQFAWRFAAALVSGMVLALGVQSVWAFWLSQTGADETARLQAQQKHNGLQAQLDAAQQKLQQQTQLQSQMQSRHQHQQQTLQWQAVLQDNPTAIWYEQLGQEGSAWRLTGQALAKADVQRLQSQLARLPIWHTPPTLKHWGDAPPAPQVRMPVWAFELAGVLLEVEGAHQLEGATQNAALNASHHSAEASVESSPSVVTAKQPFTRAVP
jgi:Tfp pilus assembly protein PilN